VVGGGLALLLGLSAVLQLHAPMAAYAQVAAAWIVALWCYPQALHGVWTVPVRTE